MKYLCNYNVPDIALHKQVNNIPVSGTFRGDGKLCNVLYNINFLLYGFFYLNKAQHVHLMKIFYS